MHTEQYNYWIKQIPIECPVKSKKTIKIYNVTIKAKYSMSLIGYMPKNYVFFSSYRRKILECKTCVFFSCKESCNMRKLTDCNALWENKFIIYDFTENSEDLKKVLLDICEIHYKSNGMRLTFFSEIK